MQRRGGWGNFRRRLFFFCMTAIIMAYALTELAMTGRAIFASMALFFAASVAPALADGAWHFGHSDYWWRTHEAIYQLGNRIAFLEANPEIDDGYKGPIITGARAEMLWWRASLPPAHWRWSVPCCYGRRPIHIR
jgi:hypothetical protein